jgi:hypothetical protein
MKTMFRSLALVALTALAASAQTPTAPAEKATPSCCQKEKAKDGSDMCAKTADKGCCCCAKHDGAAAAHKH